MGDHLVTLEPCCSEASLIISVEMKLLLTHRTLEDWYDTSLFFEEEQIEPLDSPSLPRGEIYRKGKDCVNAIASYSTCGIFPCTRRPFWQILLPGRNSAAARCMSAYLICGIFPCTRMAFWQIL